MHEISSMKGEALRDLATVESHVSPFFPFQTVPVTDIIPWFLYTLCFLTFIFCTWSSLDMERCSLHLHLANLDYLVKCHLPPKASGIPRPSSMKSLLDEEPWCTSPPKNYRHISVFVCASLCLTSQVFHFLEIDSKNLHQQKDYSSFGCNTHFIE